jgi:hypothetical protein
MEKPQSPDKTLINDWTIRIVGLTMSVAIAISSFFLKEAWYKISDLEKKVNTIMIAAAEPSGNRFTSTNWIDAKSILDSERLAQDRRIMRLEESVPVIKESLLEIKQTLRKQSDE